MSPFVGFLNVGLPETLVIAGVLLLLFAPKAARSVGGLARQIFEFKRGIDGAKDDLSRTVSREIHSALGADDDDGERRRKPPKKDA
jgi:Sec-independent protein translocase protein TatA